MNISEDITIKATIEQNYLGIYSQCKKFRIKQKKT